MIRQKELHLKFKTDGSMGKDTAGGPIWHCWGNEGCAEHDTAQKTSEVPAVKPTRESPVGPHSADQACR